MMPPPRTDRSSFAQWWRNIDRFSLLVIILLMGIGYILILAASPAVAQRISASSRFFFIWRQMIFLSLSIIVILIISHLSIKKIRILATFLGLIALGATVMTLLHGMEIKGARRWVSLPLMSIQPSEFLKPCFAVVTGWLLSIREEKKIKYMPFLSTRALACLLFFFIAFLLQAQPDIGMLSVISAVFLTQLFIDGLAWSIVSLLIIGSMAAFYIAFLTFHHVRSRVERFLHSDVGDHYQIDTSLRAFAHGGLFGRGPGEGRVKDLLPDAHADFIFAVAGEEYGFIFCSVIILLFLAFIIRSLLKLLKDDNRFIIISGCGLVAGFGLQATVNMASSLHLIPTKGMTLPFISYGGSSALSLSLAVGMLLALTRQRIEGGLYAPSPSPPYNKIGSPQLSSPNIKTHYTVSEHIPTDYIISEKERSL